MTMEHWWSRSGREHSSTVKLRLSGTPIIRIGLALPVNLMENSTKLICLEITGYQAQQSFFNINIMPHYVVVLHALHYLSLQ